MSGSPELNPLFVGVSPPPAAPRRRNMFQRESTRLRSNVADQVQRDLLPAGRLLSVFRVMCELLAEIAVLCATWSQGCDRPLRFWVVVLMTLQTATVLLHCLNIWHGRDAFSPHRAGLSASDPDMYEGATVATVANTGANAPVAPAAHRSAADSHVPATLGFSGTQGAVRIEVGVDNTMLRHPPRRPPSPNRAGVSQARERHTRGSTSDEADRIGTRTTDVRLDNNAPLLPGTPSDETSERTAPEFVDHYVRIVNAVYLIWYIIGSVWVSGGGTCYSSAPHLYRLVVALTIIYYALLFLPLACFCLIVCCLPLFILVYRIMLPYAERERRRARAADPSLVQSLSSVSFSPATFPQLSGADSVEDASCVICLCDYEQGERLRFLPCKHHFHQECVDVWLQLDKACCLCKQDIDSQPAASPV